MTTTTMEDDDEKSSGLLMGLVKSAVDTLAAAVGWNGQSKDDCITDMDVDSMGPIIEIGEELSEVLFQSLLDSCTEDEVLVRSVI